MRVRSSKSAAIVMLMTGACSALACLSACSTIDGYRRNPTPEIITLGQTRDEVMNQRTVVIDTNLRELHEDAARFFLMDRPSRLTTQNVPY